MAASQDTVRSAYGSFLLAPANGSGLKSAILEYYRRLGRLGSRDWLHVYGTTASSVWALGDDGSGNSLSNSVSTFGIGILYHRQFFSGRLAETEVGIDGEIGVAGRWLDGDIRNLLNDSATKAQYLSAFKTEKNFFAGLEAGMTINFGQVIGSVQAYYLFPKAKEPINGLTGLQLAIGLSVRGDIIKGFLDRKEDSE